MEASQTIVDILTTAARQAKGCQAISMDLQASYCTTLQGALQAQLDRNVFGLK
jgi:hypothetical protein